MKFKDLALTIPILIMISCSASNNSQNIRELKSETNPDAHYKWDLVLDSADWKKNYNFEMMTHNDTLWVMHPDGNWFSIDGKNWQKSTLENSINNLAFLDYVYFKNALYGIGYFDGNIEKYDFKSRISKTTDFKNWEVIDEKSNLPERFFYHPFEFNNKLWIIGGEDKNKKYSDIWNSDNAIKWNNVKTKSDLIRLGGEQRSGSQIVKLKDTLYLLNNDVWKSTDAINWTLVSDEIIKGENLFGYKAIVFDEKIWLLGCNRNGQFTSNVLYSDNGKEWTSMNAPWSPRGGIAATVFNNKIYMTGGKYGGTPEQPEFKYSNDLWSLGH